MKKMRVIILLLCPLATGCAMTDWDHLATTNWVDRTIVPDNRAAQWAMTPLLIPITLVMFAGEAWTLSGQGQGEFDEVHQWHKQGHKVSEHPNAVEVLMVVCLTRQRRRFRLWKIDRTANKEKPTLGAFETPTDDGGLMGMMASVLPLDN